MFNPDSSVTLRGNFLAKWTNGLLETPQIGPVKTLKSLHWSREAFDDASDYANLTVWGVREGQDDTLLLQLATTFDTSLAFIPVSQFPQIKLRYNTGDTLLRSFTQPRYLRIVYDGVRKAPRTLFPPSVFTGIHFNRERPCVLLLPLPTFRISPWIVCW